MRFAVISDIHGNCLALEAVLDDIGRQGVDTTLNLGDLLSGPLQPVETAQLLMGLDLPTLAGNHERYLLTGTPSKLPPVDRYVLTEMGQVELAWLQRLPKTHVIADKVFMCHGTPADDGTPWLDAWFNGRNVTLPDEAAVAAPASGLNFPVLLCGHTHVPRAVRLRDGRLIVNPGSVGLQMHYGSPDARYAIIEESGGRWSVTFRAVPYDHLRAAAIAADTGFPLWAEVIATGWPGAEGLF